MKETHVMCGIALSPKGFLARLVIPFMPDVAALVLIRFLFHRNAVLLAALALVLASSLAWRPSRMKTAVAFWGIILGTFGEWACVRVGMWVYTHPGPLGLPPWLPLVWPILMISFLEMSEYLDETGRGRFPRVYKVAVGLLLLLSLAATGLALRLVGGPISLIFFLFLTLAVSFAHRPFHVILFATAAVIGFSGEFLCVRFGVWHYTRPVLRAIGMPVSLPLAWGLSALLVWLLARATFGRSRPAQAASHEAP